MDIETRNIDEKRLYQMILQVGAVLASSPDALILDVFRYFF